MTSPAAERIPLTGMTIIIFAAVSGRNAAVVAGAGLG